MTNGGHLRSTLQYFFDNIKVFYLNLSNMLCGYMCKVFVAIVCDLWLPLYLMAAAFDSFKSILSKISKHGMYIFLLRPLALLFVTLVSFCILLDCTLLPHY